MSARDDYPEADVFVRGLVLRTSTRQAVEAALNEIDDLRRWKREATMTLAAWDVVFEVAEAIGDKALLGHSKSEHVLRTLRNLT